MAELRRCPFCGGEAFVDYHKFWDEKTKDFTVKTYGVFCDKCGSNSWQHYRTEEEAIEAWNNRATEAEIRAKAIEEFSKLLIELNNEFPTVEDDYGEIRPMRIEEMCERISEQMKGEKE